MILTPGKWCYLDKAQDAPHTQPRAAGGYLPIDSVYALPNPFGANTSHLLGVQGNLWAEKVPTPQHAEYMIWPRAYAIAELGRHGLTAERHFAAFHQRALAATTWLRDTLGINAFDLSQEIGERTVDAATHAAAPCDVTITYNTQPHRAYPGSGNRCLIDGIFGGWNNNDGRWQGFIGRKGMDVTIDLGHTTKLRSIAGDFMQSCGPDIFFPHRLVITVSKDGHTFHPLFDHQNDDIYAVRNEDYQQLAWQGKTSARYIRIQALPGPKQGWVFCSEIMIK